MAGLFSSRQPGDRGIVEGWFSELLLAREEAINVINGEWFLYVLSELFAEPHCFLHFQIRRKPWYMQFVVGAAGDVLVEVSSNEVLPPHARLDEVQQTRLVELGWELPTCGWPEPLDAPGFRSPNYWRRWPAPVPAGEIAMLVLRTLKAVFDADWPVHIIYMFFHRSSGRSGRHPHPHPAVLDPAIECFMPHARIERWTARAMPGARSRVRIRRRATGWFYPKVWGQAPL